MQHRHAVNTNSGEREGRNSLRVAVAAGEESLKEQEHNQMQEIDKTIVSNLYNVLTAQSFVNRRIRGTR